MTLTNRIGNFFRSALNWLYGFEYYPLVIDSDDNRLGTDYDGYQPARPLTGGWTVSNVKSGAKQYFKVLKVKDEYDGPREVQIRCYTEPLSTVNIDYVSSNTLRIAGPLGGLAVVVFLRDCYVADWVIVRPDGSLKDVTPPMWQGQFIKAYTMVKFRLSTSAIEVHRERALSGEYFLSGHRITQKEID